ncbi:MAG TPA: hypothetical protein VL335_00435 [Candidatus Paceibacterota bacterium]|nr:hypothetical protein [Candidatus Paceibacterota bacterium]
MRSIITIRGISIHMYTAATIAVRIRTHIRIATLIRARRIISTRINIRIHTTRIRIITITHTIRIRITDIITGSTESTIALRR